MMRKEIDYSKIQDFNIMSVIFGAELLIIVISAYPLAKFLGSVGIIIWLAFSLITFGTAHIIEKYKKSDNIQTYKEIIAFVEKKPLTYEESQQEIGKRNYQKIIVSLLVGVIALIISLIIVFIINNI